jgi:ferritin-like metal-binding protein YciE
MQSEVRDTLVDQFKDAHSAEKQARRGMQKAPRMASAEPLRSGIQHHIDQTQTHVERVEEALEKLNALPGRKMCEAMRGILEEAQHEFEDHEERDPAMDLLIAAELQRVEHYEIASYGTAVAIAKAVKERDVESILDKTLQEEKETDRNLTEVSERALMPAAMNGGGR